MIKFLTSVAEKVAEDLVDRVKIQWSYVFNSHHHVEDLLLKIDDLGLTREKVEELVEEANRQGDQIFPQVQEWLQATERILQTREAFVQDASEGRFYLKSHYNLSRRAKRQREDIDARLQQAHGFGETVSKRPRPPPSTSSASSTNDAEAFPSRRLIFDQIMEVLRNEQRSILGVWGMGGVGKTTLARQVAKRAEEEKLFDKVVMASSISQTPNISEIQREIARTLGLHFPEGEDRAVRLMNSLKNQKKILVIIDDIWDKLDLGEIGIPYGDDHKGCKLLLTSREYEVVFTDMKAQQVFHLPHLEAEEARRLFKRTAGYSVEELPELKDIADDILRKCEGLPIAIITIANALKDKRVGEWKNALKELKMANPINVRGMSKNVYNCLELSYNRLEGDEVKSLFLLCGSLGGRRISMDHLLLYAKGLDMFPGMYSIEDATNKVITLVQKLIASSLLLKAEEEDNNGHWSLFFDDSFVKIHDVVRDVARSIASRDAHRQYVMSDTVELRELETRGECRNYRGISLECGVEDELPPTLVCPELELFLLNSSVNPGHILRIPEDFFQRVTKLRVLQMSEVSLRVSPSSPGFLSNLRTLCLFRCPFEDMTIIREMKGLQFLSLGESRIVELPKEIGQLKDLRLLALRDCYELRIIPLNVILSLSRLECLSIRGCDKIEWVFISKIKDLPELRTLEVNVRDSSLLPAEDIGLDLINLTRYSIMIGDDHFNELNHFARNLGARDLTSLLVLLKIFSNLFETCQAVELTKLDGIRNVVYDLAKENGFPLLEHLEIKMCGTIKHIVSSSLKWVPPRDTFRRLDRLHLFILLNLESVVDFHGSAPFLVECFGKLRVLRLYDCYKLRCVMSLPMQHGRELNFFPRLQKLELFRLPNLISFYFAATPQNSQLESMSKFFNQQAAFPALEELVVDHLGVHSQSLWNNQFPTNSFSKVKKLEVEYCGGLQKVCYVSFVKALAQLEKLRIVNCESAEEIVANEGNDVEDEAAFFPKLTHLHLENLVLLKRFCSAAIKLRWPLLKDLKVQHCDDQVGILFDEIGLEGEVDAPAPLFLVEQEAFLDLETLEMSSMQGVVEIWRGQFSRTSFSQLRVLIVEFLWGISFVISSTIIQNLYNLEELKVRHCVRVNEIIQLLDDEPTIDEIDFNRLKSLRLSGLTNLRGFCLARCTFRFPSLEDLDLSNCPRMEFFCKGDSHIGNDTLKEYIESLNYNTQAIHETSTAILHSTSPSGASYISSTSQHTSV